MRKTTIAVIITLFAGLMVFSCVQPLEPGVRTEATGANQLNLTVSCQAPSTKADPFANYPAGVTELNENKIEHIDWFIFRDTTSGAAWQSGRVSFSDKSDGTTEFSVKTLDMDQYKALYEDGKGYVLTVANYPDEEGHETTFGNKTFAQIRQMELVTEGLGNMADGAFTPLNSFVMTSYATPFTLVENNPVTVNAQLTRLAAKISLNISIVPYIDEIKAYVSGLDTTRIEYVQTWYPDVAGIRAYMTYANMHTTLTPNDTNMRAAEVYNDNNFFTYNSRGFKLDTPVPTTSDGTSIVTGSPFYSYPMQWETSDAHAPFIKIILKWEGYEEPSTNYPGGGHYITHTSGGLHAGDTVKVTSHDKTGRVTSPSQNFYYKVSLPSKHNVLHSNVWTKINLDVAVLGGVDEEQTVDVIGRYYVVDWNDPDVEGGGELTAGKYLSLATSRDTFYIYGGNSIKIPVKSSHDLEVVNENGNRPTGTYYNYTSATPSTGALAYSTTSAAGNNFTISTGGRSTVTLTHELVADLNSAQNRDISTITYKFRIRHANNASSLYKDITVIQYPSIYIESLTPGDAYVDGRKAVANSAVQTPYYQINYDNAATTIYYVHVSAFNGDSKYYYPRRQNVTPDQRYEYIITDPRVNAGWGAGDIAAYGANNDNTTDWPVETVQNMMVGASTQNFIAPSFLVSSRWGRPGGGMNFETAKKRCATYQEAGYPAGRWRLPTEAEVYFLFTLQANGLITTLYTTGTGTYGYWASSEYVFGRGYTAGSTPDFRRLTTGQVASIRCVYDTWYWGDKPESRDTYHPGPTIYNN